MGFTALGNGVYKLIFSLICLLLLFPESAVSRADVLVLSSPGSRIRLSPYLSVYKDESDSMDIGQVINQAADPDRGFSPLAGNSGFGYSGTGFWFRLSVKNPTDKAFPWLIEYPYAVVDHFEFFAPSPEGFKVFRGGDRHPFDSRPVNFRTMVIPVDILPGTQTFYFKIRSGGAVVVPLTGWAIPAFERYKRLDTAVNWLFYGIMLSTAVYCMFIFFSMKEPVFLWLTVFVTGASLFTLAHTGLGAQYFWPDNPAWANLCHPLAVFLAMTGALRFSRLFLNTAYHSPFFDRLFSGLFWIGAGFLFLGPFIPYALLTQASVFSIGIAVLSMIFSGILLLQKQVRHARFYLIAWSPFAVSALLMGIKSYGFIENNLITDSTIQITAAFVTFLFSFGLMDKINGFRLEREAAISRLHRSEKKYRMLANNIKDVIWVLDLHTMKITYITPSIREMMGYTPREAKKMFSFREMLPPDSARKAISAVRKYKPGAGPARGKTARGFTIELETYHKNGTVFWTETSTALVENREGDPVEMVGITRDITARRQAEKEKQALEFQLNQSGKLEAMGTLAGGIAHDMNNIMAAILGYTELSLHEAEKGSRMHHRLSRVVKASHRARDLVRQILTFSRQERLEARTIKIGLIVKEILALIRASLPATITIVREIQDRDIAVKADPTQVHQIVMNLCSNAGYAMMERGGTLRVIVEKMVLDEVSAGKYLDLEPGHYVRLVVSDTGRGMDKEILDRIFDPFYTTKPVGEGTGMGLSMVHGIVKNLGGDIDVQSKPGHGSDFHVILPRDMSRESVYRDEASPRMPAGRERLLYVDDEPDIVDMAVEMLAGLGYNVVGKTDSREALGLIESDPAGFDMLITDQTMPGVTGVELIVNAKKIRPDLPVILCTGFSEKMPEDAAREANLHPLLLKPYDEEAIAGRVRRVLDEGVCVG
ncbi:MAG: ATP-binding protein [Desulfobacterales bacterium]|nr:ATP-binding protein [Desulfobacterales bacterium]